MENLTRSQRAADIVTEFCGSWTFIAIGSALTAVWIAINTIWLVSGSAFDPYPFIMFNLVLTVVSTFQSPLIMMSQNRQMERDRDAVQGLHAKLDVLIKEGPGRARWRVARSDGTATGACFMYSAALDELISARQSDSSARIQFSLHIDGPWSDIENG
jgi:hypothetical protein